MKNIFDENLDEDELLLQEVLKDVASFKKAQSRENEEEISYCAKVLEIDLENAKEEVD